jgi:UDP-2,4-diacetamido-2,4,6-trideoxy-beta-L-altropyranose hydrolase
MSSNIRNILFRADSSSTIGIGHIMRDLVLAKQYPEANITFATQDLNGNINHKIIEAGYKLEILKSNSLDELDELIKKLYIDMIVIDHYGIDLKDEKRLKESNSTLKIMVLDDTYEKHHCDILLNHNIYGDETKYKELVPQNCELRCGSKYTLLRDEFIEEKRKPKTKNERFTIFVAMGGADSSNVNPKILNILSSYRHNILVNIVTTSANQNLKELLEYCSGKTWIRLHINSNKVANLLHNSDLAIATPSVTINEVWFMNIPFVAIKVAENQNDMYEFLKNYDYVVMEYYSDFEFKIILKKLGVEYEV